VVIKLNSTENILRPSMTTGNKIVTKTIDDVTYIPLESIQETEDSIPFVYMKNRTRQVVVLGESNENNIVVEQGIEPGDQIFLNTPEDPEKFSKLSGEELIETIKEKERIRLEEEKKRANETPQQNFGRGGEMMGMPPGMGGGQGGGRTMDTAAMRRFRENMGGNMPGGGPGGTMDTAAMRRFRESRQNMPQGGARDTSARRRPVNVNPGNQ